MCQVFFFFSPCTLVFIHFIAFDLLKIGEKILQGPQNSQVKKNNNNLHPGLICFLSCVSIKSMYNEGIELFWRDLGKNCIPLCRALWFILRGDLFYVLPCVILFLYFSVLLALRLPRLGKRELILVLFVRLFDLCLFGFVGFLFLLVSGKGCGL